MQPLLLPVNKYLCYWTIYLKIGILQYPFHTIYVKESHQTCFVKL